MKPQIKRILEAMAADGEVEFTWLYPDEWPTECYVYPPMLQDDNGDDIEQEPLDMVPVFQEMLEAGLIDIQFEQYYDYRAEDVGEHEYIVLTDAGRAALAAADCNAEPFTAQEDTRHE